MAGTRAILGQLDLVMITFGASPADCVTVDSVLLRGRSVWAFVMHSSLHNPLDELGDPAPNEPVIEQTHAGHAQFVSAKAGDKGGHAATSREEAGTAARCNSQSAACCALDAAVKIARLSAFRTFSHD